MIASLAIIGWIAQSDGMVDRNGKPIGTDFSSFFAAGALASEGRASEAYDMALHYAREQLLFGETTPHYAWLYPPSFLVFVTPLALLPYPAALGIWQGSTLALYLAVIAGVLRGARLGSRLIARIWLPVAAAFPAVFINLGHGQNGLLSAALFGGALLQLPRHPLIAGFLFGLLTYKPQLALVIPFALLAGGQWRAIAAACVSALILAGISFLLFGADVWWSFLASAGTSQKLLLEEGDVGFEKLQTLFAAVRMWGGSVILAYVAQGAVSGAAICCTAWIWRSNQSHEIKASLLLVATTLASPHILDYDLMLLAPSLAFLVVARAQDHLRKYEISLLAAIWAAPLLARPVAGLTGVPIGLLGTLALFILIARTPNRAPASLRGGSDVIAAHSL